MVHCSVREKVELFGNLCVAVSMDLFNLIPVSEGCASRTSIVYRYSVLLISFATLLTITLMHNNGTKKYITKSPWGYHAPLFPSSLSQTCFFLNLIVLDFLLLNCHSIRTRICTLSVTTQMKVLVLDFLLSNCNRIIKDSYRYSIGDYPKESTCT